MAATIETLIEGRQRLMVEQKFRSFLEVLTDWEAANTYRLRGADGAVLGTIEEMSSGFKNALVRIFTGSHRPLNIEVREARGDYKTLGFKRKFFWFFSNMDVMTPDDKLLGHVRRRFGLIYKRYDLLDKHGDVFATIASPFWRLWTFPILNRSGEQVATISKKWSGLGKEIFTDVDTFMLDYGDHSWSIEQKAVIFAAAISIDFDFFENNNKK